MKKNILHSVFLILIKKFSFICEFTNLKRFIPIFLGLFFLLPIYSATITSTASGNWSAGATWVGGIAPIAGDNAIIAAGHNVTIDVVSSCRSVTINGTLTGSTNNLNVNGGAFTNNGTFNCNTGTIILRTGSSIAGTNPSTFYKLTINTLASTDIVPITTSPVTIADAGTLTLTNGVFKIGAANTLTFTKACTITRTATSNFANSLDGTGLNTDADGGTVNLGFNSNANATINNGPTFYNVNCTDGNGTVALGAAGNIRINGLFKVSGAGSNQFKTSGNSPIWGPNSTFNYNGNTQWNFVANFSSFWNATGTVGVTPGYPNNVTLVNVNTATISQDRSINGVLSAGDGVTAGNITISGGTAGAFSCGGLNIYASSTFIAPAANMTIKGNYTKTGGTFTHSGGTVTFAGTGTSGSPNTIVDNSSTNFFKLVIANNAYVKLNSTVVLPATGTFTLTSGILETATASVLSVTNTATTAITGGSATSFINGPVKWTLLNAGTNTYNFPVGKGATYLPFTLNSKNTAAGNIATVEAFASNPGGSGLTLSTTEYWSMNTAFALGTAGSTVSISRPTAIAPLSLIGKSTTANGVYTSLAGTAGANGITGSNDIGTASPWFFAFAAPSITAPIVTTPTATNITSTTATLGANITSDGGSAITSRGTAYKLTSPVAATDNPLTGGTATGVYTNNRLGLSPQTLYYYRGYAINAIGTGMSPEASFRTLSSPPTAQPATFTGTAGNAQVVLNWTSATYPAAGATKAGYLLIYSTGVPSLIGAPNGIAPAGAVSNGTIVAVSDSNLPGLPPLTATAAGLTNGTNYNFLIVPYTWDGVNPATYDYLTTSAKTASATPFFSTVGKSVTVTVNPIPTVVITNPAAVCSPGTANLTAAAVTVGSTAGLTYTYWTDAAGTIPYLTPNTAGAGTYYIKGTTLAGCFDIKPVTITVTPLNTIAAGTNQTVCINSAITNITLATTGATGATFTGLPAGVTGSWAANTVTISGTPSVAGPFTYTVTTTGGCPPATTTGTITINPNPTITVNSPTICNGSSTTLTANGGTSYAWSPATGLSAVTGTSVTANPIATTVYTVTGTDGNGCVNTATSTVTVNPIPIVTITNPAAVCSPATVNLTAAAVTVGSTAGLTYTYWTDAAGTIPYLTPAAAGAGTYYIKGTTAANCFDIKPVTVTVNTSPTYVFSMSDRICEGASVTLTLTLTGTQPFSFEYTDGVTPELITNYNSTTWTRVVSPTSTTSYAISNVSDSNCSAH